MAINGGSVLLIAQGIELIESKDDKEKQQSITAAKKDGEGWKVETASANKFDLLLSHSNAVKQTSF